jgi:hypothetical protein
MAATTDFSNAFADTRASIKLTSDIEPLVSYIGVKIVLTQRAGASSLRLLLPPRHSAALFM